MVRIAAISAAVLTIALASAQAQPARIGNTFDGTHHQPTPSGLAGTGGATGPTTTPTPPPPAPSSNNAVDPLGAKLLHDEQVDPPRNATPRP